MCGLYTFWSGISFFDVLNVSSFLIFGLFRFIVDLLYKNVESHWFRHLAEIFQETDFLTTVFGNKLLDLATKFEP